MTNIVALAIFILNGIYFIHYLNPDLGSATHAILQNIIG